MARTNYTSLGINTIGDNDSDIELTVKRYDPISEIERDAIVNPLNGMKIYNSDTNTIQGYANGAWPVPSGETVVIAHEDAWAQNRTQGIFPHTGGASDGIILSPLDTIVTPQKAGNKMIIQFFVFGEATNSAECGFVITRNNVLMEDTTDGTNNDYAVNAVSAFDGNNSSTPSVTPVVLIDNNTLSIESTYKVLFRSTETGTAQTFYLNRSINSPASSAETGVSTSKVIEYVT